MGDTVSVADRAAGGRRRLLTAIAVAAGCGAVVVAALGVRQADGESGVVVDVEPAAAAVPPRTVAPFAVDADTPTLADGTTPTGAPGPSSDVRTGPAPRPTDGGAAPIDRTVDSFDNSMSRQMVPSNSSTPHWLPKYMIPRWSCVMAQLKPPAW